MQIDQPRGDDMVFGLDHLRRCRLRNVTVNRSDSFVLYRYVRFTEKNRAQIDKLTAEVRRWVSVALVRRI